MRHFHRDFHGKNQGVKVSPARNQERHFHTPLFPIGGVKVCLSIGVKVSGDFHGDFHGWGTRGGVCCCSGWGSDFGRLVGNQSGARGGWRIVGSASKQNRCSPALLAIGSGGAPVLRPQQVVTP